MIKRLFNYLLNGRPMTKLCFCFTDRIDGQAVNLYVDGYGRHWLAQSRWASFRIPSEHWDEWLLQDGNYEEYRNQIRANDTVAVGNRLLH